MMVFTSARAVGVQFYRTVTLVVLGLSVVALLFGAWPLAMPGPQHLAIIAAFTGFVLWTLGRVTAARYVTVFLFFFSSVAALLPLTNVKSFGSFAQWFVAIGELFTSSLLLGSMMAAMLLGHSYLIAPTMSIDPLKRLVIWIAASVAGRAGFAGLAMIVSGLGRNALPLENSWWWTLVAARWLIGLVGPAVVAWMVWQTARIRATQSATGILYAGVVLTFFGELVSQLLSSRP
jgi:hypothetical protein